MNTNIKNQMSQFEIREALAETGQTTINQMIKWMDVKHKGKYDKKVARAEAAEMVKEMKEYL